MIPATISAIRQATPTIKVFTLDTGGEQFQFKAGQWLDFYVDLDGEEGIGGYSMTSSPLTAGSVELAIKESEANPVTRHLHERARVGDRVTIDGGQGDCYYEAGMAASLVLVAGGIGITPIISIVRYSTVATPEVPVTLLYAATSPEELLFREELETLAARDPRFHVEFYVTRGEAGPLHAGHIDEDALRATLDREAVYFVCGPPAMIDRTVEILGHLGIPPAHVRFERWW